MLVTPVVAYGVGKLWYACVERAGEKNDCRCLKRHSRETYREMIRLCVLST